MLCSHWLSNQYHNITKQCEHQKPYHKMDFVHIVTTLISRQIFVFFQDFRMSFDFAGRNVFACIQIVKKHNIYTHSLIDRVKILPFTMDLALLVTIAVILSIIW